MGLVDDRLDLEQAGGRVHHAADLRHRALIGPAVADHRDLLAGGQGLAHLVGDVEGDRLVAAVGDDKGHRAGGSEIVQRQVDRLHHPGDGGGHVVEGQLVLGGVHAHLGGLDPRPGGAQTGPGRLDPGLGGQQGLVGLVHLRLGGGSHFKEVLGILIVILSQTQLLLQHRQVGPAIARLGAVIALLGALIGRLGVLKGQAGALVIDAAQRISGGDCVPHRDHDLLHIAGDQGDHAGGALRGNGPDIGALGAQLAGLGGGGLHRHRLVQHGLLLLRAAGQRQGQGRAEHSGNGTFHGTIFHPFSHIRPCSTAQR